jgi:hypothetical protein
MQYDSRHHGFEDARDIRKVIEIERANQYSMWETFFFQRDENEATKTASVHGDSNKKRSGEFPG